MLTVFSQQISGLTTIESTGLNGLANGSAMTSSSRGSVTPIPIEELVQININGTASATGWLSVAILQSTNGVDFDTPESAVITSMISLTASPQQITLRFPAPYDYRVYLKNMTGAILGSSGNTVQRAGSTQQGA